MFCFQKNIASILKNAKQSELYLQFKMEDLQIDKQCFLLGKYAKNQLFLPPKSA